MQRLLRIKSMIEVGFEFSFTWLKVQGFPHCIIPHQPSCFSLGTKIRGHIFFSLAVPLSYKIRAPAFSQMLRQEPLLFRLPLMCFPLWEKWEIFKGHVVTTFGFLLWDLPSCRPDTLLPEASWPAWSAVPWGRPCTSQYCFCEWVGEFNSTGKEEKGLFYP